MTTRSTLCSALIENDEVSEYSDDGSFEYEIGNVGRKVSDLGLNPPPGPGLWLWEGVHHYEFLSDTCEVDAYFEGAYRSITEDEAARLFS